MTDKIVKENENFTWYETIYGIGYVVSKKCYFHISNDPTLLEIIPDDYKDQEKATQISALLNHHRKTENELSN